MVVLNREIANINSFHKFSAISNPVKAKKFSENVNMDELRGRSVISSCILSRVMLAYLDILSIPYIKRIEVQSNDSFWFGQTKQENFQLLYRSPKDGNSPDQNNVKINKDRLSFFHFLFLFLFSFHIFYF